MEAGAREVAVPEIIVVLDAVEGTFVDLDGESHRELVEAKLSRRGRETLNEGEEVKSQKQSDSRGIRRNTGQRHDQPVSVVFQHTLAGFRRKAADNVQWRHVVERKAYCGKMWKMMGKEPCVRVIW